MKGSDIYVNQNPYVDGDPKPSGAFIGQELKATNGKVWEWSGSAWNLTVTTTSDGSPAVLAVAEVAGISGVYKTFYIISDDATAMTDAADHRVDDAIGFKAFRITPITQVVQNMAYGWSTDAADYAALETKLTTVLGQIATPTGAAQENARAIGLEGAAGTTTSKYEAQGWITYDGTTTIKTITTQNAGAAQTIMVEVLV